MKKQLLTFLALLITGIISAQVGIGTTTPTQALDIETNEAGGTAIDINNTGTGDPKINLQLNGTTTFSIGVDNDDADKLKIGTSAPETNTRVTIDNTGNVGVGTSTPGAKLDVDGSAIFNESGAAVNFRVESDANANMLFIDGTNNRVGVGTGAPDATFQVNGSFKLVDGNQSNGKVLTSDANGVATWQTASGGGLPAGTSGQTLRHDGTTWVANSVLFNNGTNVGVGTASPGAKLDVDGSATFNESGAAVNFRVESDANTHMLFVDGTNNEIGINTSAPSSTFDIQGSLGYKVTTITAATTLNQTHNVVLCNTGPYTVTLPAAASNTGKVYYIKNIDADGDDITIDANASETIDGALTFRLDPYKHAVRLICDGTNWHVIEESGNNTQNSQSSFTVVNCNGSIFSWSNVTNATTGKVWMDRNLGASQVATNSTDANSYGDLYQWGRAKDGHQCRTSSTTATLSKDNTPTHGDFITSAGDWRSSQNDNLWQGVSGINNPCPSGYRLPTEAEWTAESGTWGSTNLAGAFGSVLRLPASGGRNGTTGALYQVGTNGSYWSSSINGTGSRGPGIDASLAYFTTPRAFGLTVRCIKN